MSAQAALSKTSILNQLRTIANRDFRNIKDDEKVFMWNLVSVLEDVLEEQPSPPQPLTPANDEYCDEPIGWDEEPFDPDPLDRYARHLPNGFDVV